MAFYNQYRTIVVNNLAKAGNVIKHKNNEALTRDEKMKPMLENIVLLNVIREIDIRLPSFVKNHYNHKMSPNERLMEFKTDILVNVPAFLMEIENNEQINASREASLIAIKRFTNLEKSLPLSLNYIVECVGWQRCPGKYMSVIILEMTSVHNYPCKTNTSLKKLSNLMR